MVRHMVIWRLKEEFSEEEKSRIRQGIKEGLEGLVGVVPGLVSATVHTDLLPTSNMDVMLESVIESADMVKQYAAHPAHQAVANEKVRPFTCLRAAVDLEIKD